MEKLDLRKQYQTFYKPSSKSVEVVEIPEFRFAMIAGLIEKGLSPGESPSFQEAIEALYGISYTIKFMSKKREKNPIDYQVMALEALWWVVDGHFDIKQPDNWSWNAIIMQPDHITPEMFTDATEQLKVKKPNPALDKLRFETFKEGLCMQIMHIGPYADEPETLRMMEIFAKENDFAYRGKHHEIYLGDPRRAKPENLKTILRQPIKKTL